MNNNILRNKSLRAGVAGACSVIILIAMLMIHAWPLWTGKPIYLKVQPVDPRDLFRGDYVTLGYDISRLRVTPDEPKEAWQRSTYVKPISDSLKQNLQYLKPGKLLFVQLQELPSQIPGVPSTYAPVSISDKPEPGAINLQGRSMFEIYGQYVTMNYGIDAFYVQEHTGHDIEDFIRRGKDVFAEVMVTPSGKARLKTLLVDGKRISE